MVKFSEFFDSHRSKFWKIFSLASLGLCAFCFLRRLFSNSSSHKAKYFYTTKFKGRRGGFFKVKKKEYPNICARNWSRRLIFGYIIPLWIFYRLVPVFDFQHSPSLKLGITEFWPEVVPTNVYLIRRQTESFDRIGAILVHIEQSK